MGYWKSIVVPKFKKLFEKNNVKKAAGNRYSLKDKNEAKTDKTEHENGKSVKSQNQSQSRSQSEKSKPKMCAS
ncbi:plasma membrane-associated cation-binding protein 1-like protein [Tanacetum coccineum]